MKIKSESLYLSTLLVCLLFLPNNLLTAETGGPSYAIVDTGQDRTYSDQREIPYPKKGQDYFGQDAQYRGNPPLYQDNQDGTVTDLITGLMWQKTPSRNKMSGLDKAKQEARSLNFAGHSDWRVPTIKELYSLIDFRGYSMQSTKESVPYINTDYFDFYFGDESEGERLIDAQYWTSTVYVSTTMGGNPTVFGVNFADGRIKGYPLMGSRAKKYIRYVRGNPNYGENYYVDNGDGTITDEATGLIWAKADSGKKLNWKEALAFAEDFELAGHDDWRLPNAKELHSIVDYTRSPAAKNADAQGPAIDPLFELTEDESWFWTGTTHFEHSSAKAAVYICFGQAFGFFGPSKSKIDVHGAGAQRSDPKSGSPSQFPTGRGPQGDEIRIYNYVRCVRGGATIPQKSAPKQDKSSYPYNTTSNYGKGTFRPQSKSQSGHSMQQQGGRTQKQGGGSSGGSQRHSSGQGSGSNRPSFVGRLDKDGDGKVSKSEFDGPSHHFSHLDKNGDGYLGEDEAPPFPPPGKR